LGDTTKTQVEYAFSNLSSRESIKIKAEGDLISSKAMFEKIFGIKPKNLIFPEGLPNCIPKEFDKFAKSSIKNNLSLKSSASQTNLSKINVANSTSALLPSIYISYQNVKNDIDQILPSVQIKEQETYQMMLNIPILPRGGSAYTNIIASKFIHNRSIYYQKYTYDQIQEDILSNWERVKVSEANLIAARSAKDFAKNSMDAMRTEYEFGTRSVLELLESEKQYYDTSVSYINAKNQRIFSYYQILSTMGNLNRSIF
jgi:adhesin transport system outer membrane protein